MHYDIAVVAMQLCKLRACNLATIVEMPAEVYGVLATSRKRVGGNRPNYGIMAMRSLLFHIRFPLTSAKTFTQIVASELLHSQLYDS